MPKLELFEKFTPVNEGVKVPINLCKRLEYFLLPKVPINLCKRLEHFLLPKVPINLCKRLEHFLLPNQNSP